jgi:enoyl-[acyl-carrier protein] reductase II
MPPDQFKAQIEETRRLSTSPFGVNLITLAPSYPGHLDLVCEMGCEVVVFAGGIPRKKDIEKAKRCGARAVCFASTAPLAHMLIDRGADALILEGSEAGGHIGPVALSVLIQQILFEVERFWVGALRNAVVDGDVARGSLMAGQSVGLVSEIKPLKAIVDEMIEDAEAELGRLQGLLAPAQR